MRLFYGNGGFYQGKAEKLDMCASWVYHTGMVHIAMRGGRLESLSRAGILNEETTQSIENGRCPACGGAVRDIWDTVSSDPAHSEHVVFICDDCGEEW